MARSASLGGISETLTVIPELFSFQKTRKRAQIVNLLGKKSDESSSQEHNGQTTRRLTLSLASIALVENTFNGVSMAKDNGFWVVGPLPVPPVENNIANEKTGTRSFLKKNMYMANIGTKNRMYRIRKYAFDLLAMDGMVKQDTLNYVQKYLRLKSTFMYYDFDRIISAATDNKQPFTDLANRLFDKVEMLEAAVKERNMAKTEPLYKETEVILREVMETMAAAYKLA